QRCAVREVFPARILSANCDRPAGPGLASSPVPLPCYRPRLTVHQLLNTLYVQTPRAYLHLDHETVRVKVEGEQKLQVPLLHLGAIVCIGDVTVSTFLLHKCSADGRAVIFLDSGGRFKARVEGPTSGNVLLRRAQHEALTDPARTLALARAFVAAKPQNARHELLR